MMSKSWGMQHPMLIMELNDDKRHRRCPQVSKIVNHKNELMQDLQRGYHYYVILYTFTKWY